MRSAAWIGAFCLLGGCSALPLFERQDGADPGGIAPAVAATEQPPADAAPLAAPPPEEARTVEEFDTTTAEAREEAAAPVPESPSEARLGTTVASLGDPATPGFWAETPLVSAARKGRLEYPSTGKSVQVELRPSGGDPGSGTRVSLPALRLLDAPLTALPQLVVYGL